ncbi:muscle LIM protein 1-like [Haemaphysalis longicornis]
MYCAPCYGALLLSPGMTPSRCSNAPSACSSWSLSTTSTSDQRASSRPRSDFGYGGGEVCARCNDIVYFAEKQVGAEGRAYHARCFSCRACEQRLASGAYRSSGGELYCEPCHRRHLGPQGYGYGLGSSLRSFPGRL